MSVGDEVFYYHSVKGKCVMGTARVKRAAYADPTVDEGNWSCVDLVPEAAFLRPVTLEQIKEVSELSELALLRQSRLSVMPVTAAEAKTLHLLGRGA
jgi:predicted RNA-binding protein with PUA-like domain